MGSLGGTQPVAIYRIRLPEYLAALAQVRALAGVSALCSRALADRLVQCEDSMLLAVTLGEAGFGDLKKLHEVVVRERQAMEDARRVLPQVEERRNWFNKGNDPVARIARSRQAIADQEKQIALLTLKGGLSP